MLGETKYYYATEENGDLVIHETPTPTNPGLNDVKFDPPVTASGSEKNPVYSEYKYPEYSGSKFLAMHKLPDGMIRLVGKYWEKGNRFAATLTAHSSDGKTVSTDVEVRRPSKLFDQSVYDKPFDETWGIRKNHIEIDELCIAWGGKIGIPPQVIKGQMFTESDKTNFHFNPSYRYEPWADDNFRRNKKYGKSYASQPFWVTGNAESPMGKGEQVPLDHQNVYPVYYPTEPISIADYTVKHWDQYFSPSRVEIIENQNLTEQFRAYALKYLNIYTCPVGEGPYSIATKLIQLDIKNKYTAYAQTRKAASYGIIQMLYTTAQTQGYNRGKTIESSLAPEKLNDEEIEMPFYQTFTEHNLQLQFGDGSSIIPERDWPNGWEQTWSDSFHEYNKRADYPTRVFSNAKKFNPQP